MAGVDLSTRESDGQVVVALRGWLDMAEAASVAAALAAVAASEPQIIVDLAALEFIDSSGVAALVRGRNLARHAGGELLLAAPQQQVLRVFTLTRLIDAFPLHATVDEAAGYSRRAAAAGAAAAAQPGQLAARRHTVSGPSPGRGTPPGEEAGRSSGSVTPRAALVAGTDALWPSSSTPATAGRWPGRAVRRLRPWSPRWPTRTAAGTR
jgi:anti-sigma B factor antagonist